MCQTPPGAFGRYALSPAMQSKQRLVGETMASTSILSHYTGSSGSQLCQKIPAEQYVAFIERLWAQIRSAEGLRLPSSMVWLPVCMKCCTERWLAMFLLTMLLVQEAEGMFSLLLDLQPWNSTSSDLKDCTQSRVENLAWPFLLQSKRTISLHLYLTQMSAHRQCWVGRAARLLCSMLWRVLKAIVPGRRSALCARKSCCHCHGCLSWCLASSGKSWTVRSLTLFESFLSLQSQVNNSSLS